MRKPIDKLEIVDISRLKRCHIYNGNTLSDVKVSFQDVKGMRKKLETLYEGRVNQAFVERVLILYLLFGDSVCPA
jgi:hypothetical protein